MRIRSTVSTFTLVLVAVAITFFWASRPTTGQPSGYKAARSPYGDGRPNLNGIWQAMNSANWDLEGHSAQPSPLVAMGTWGAIPAGRSVAEGNEIPYQPQALATKKANFEMRMTLDPELKCYLPGIPRAMYQPFPFQIVQTPTNIVMAYEYATASRVIHMQKLPPPQVDQWMGQSEGQWDGDTLVIDSTGFNDRTWFDRAGNFHSDALHVVERISPISADVLEYEATIEDPKVFTRPWKISMPLYRRQERNAQLLDFRCVEFVEELIYAPLLKRRGG